MTKESPPADAITENGISAIQPVTKSSLLTLEVVDRSIGWLERYLVSRLNAMQRATELLQERADKVPSEVDLKVGGLKELHTVRFDGVDREFASLDKRIAETSINNKENIFAALKAAQEAAKEQNNSNKEASSKMENAFSKQIGDLASLFKTTTDSLLAQIADVKERISAIENRGLGQTSAQSTQQTASNFMLAVIGTLIAIGAVVVAIIK